MKKIVEKDKKKRVLFKTYEIKLHILKIVIFNKYLPKFLAWNASINFQKFSNNSRVQLFNKCVETRQKKKVNKYNYSRIHFRLLARKGNIYGLKKGYW